MENIEKQENTKVETQVSPQQKEIFVQAAAITGMSLADFVKTALLEKSNQTLQDHGILELNVEDQQQLAGHLLNPPETPLQFQRLMKWRKQQ